jgi:predicted phosphodiesterase
MRSLCTDDQFIAAWNETGGRLRDIQDRFGFGSYRAVSHRRARIEKRRNITLASASPISIRNAAAQRTRGGRRIELSLRDGLILVGSDAHVWPGPLTTAQRGFIALAKRLKPDVIIMNGDVFDGARISRFPAGHWDQEDRPGVQQEMEACQAFLTKVEKAHPAQRIWTWGNHDARFEMRLASQAKEYKGVKGFALSDHFPEWKFCTAVFVNDNLVVKHRLKGGQHATHNNAIAAGRSIVTGHLHNPKCSPITDYNGTRYGVDGGTLADPDAKQFDYTEESPLNWRGAFAAITVSEGRLMLPELCQVWDDDRVEFRGELIRV